MRYSEAAIHRHSLKKLFRKISINFQNNTYNGVSFKIAADLQPATFFKKRLQHWYFLMNFAKSFGTVFAEIIQVTAYTN